MPLLQWKHSPLEPSQLLVPTTPSPRWESSPADRERGNHSVTFGEVPDVLSDFMDDTHAFVATNVAWLHVDLRVAAVSMEFA